MDGDNSDDDGDDDNSEDGDDKENGELGLANLGPVSWQAIQVEDDGYDDVIDDEDGERKVQHASHRFC